MYSWYTPRAVRELCFRHEIDGEQQCEKKEGCDFGKKNVLDFESSKAASLIKNTFFEWKVYG